MILNLTLKRKWFDMILRGDKREEYREVKDYWTVRLLRFKEEMEWGCYQEMLWEMRNPARRYNNISELLDYYMVAFRQFDEVMFRNGYSSHSPKFIIRCGDITIGKGREEWGAPVDKNVFILPLGCRPIQTRQ